MGLQKVFMGGLRQGVYKGQQGPEVTSQDSVRGASFMSSLAIAY